MTDNEMDDLLDLGIDESGNIETSNTTEEETTETNEIEQEIVQEVVVETEDLPWDDDDEIILDFEDVLSGFQEVGKILDSNDSPRVVASVAKKFDSLSDAFGVSSEEMVDDLNNMIQETKKEAIAYKQKGYELSEEVRASAFSIDQLTNHFGVMIETLTSSLQDGRAIQKKFTDEMLMVSIEDISPTVLMGYSEVMKAVTKQVETISKIYREVAETQVKLKGYLKEEKMVDDAESAKGGTTNIQNNYILSTQDLINKFKPE